jgi:cell division protein ZapD
MILYEHPLNERVRTYLRVEHMFHRLFLLIDRDTAIDHHYALHVLFELLDVALRADIKSDVLKDLDKQKMQLNGYRGNPAIKEEVLNEVIAEINAAFTQLNKINGKCGQDLQDNEWLMAIRGRIFIPGGTCEFDLPSYFNWQHKNPDIRRKNLLAWCATLQPLTIGLELLLRLLREAGVTHHVTAIGGHLQQSLPSGRTIQLVRIHLPNELGLIPEISGNRLMLSIRLMQMVDETRLQPSQADTSFELSLCS